MGHSSGSCCLRTVKVKSPAGLLPYQPTPLQLCTLQVGCAIMQIQCHVDHAIVISKYCDSYEQRYSPEIADLNAGFDDVTQKSVTHNDK